MKEFQVKKTDLYNTRIVEADGPDTLANGMVLARIERFSFTANNITYGVAGDQIGYWQFFPPHGPDADQWGVLPVWGFAEVIESATPEIEVGERLYGYFPPAETLLMQPVSVRPGQFIDGVAHRSALPQGYNVYRRLQAEPGYDPAFDAYRALLFPLHLTSFCLWDSMKDNDWYGADQVVIISASSKTSIGLGFAMSKDADAPQTIALTSARNADFVKKLGYYGSTVTYDDLEAIDVTRPTVIVDMSGNGELLGELHQRLGDQLKRCLNVGLTHWEEGAANPHINKERSEFFFAPGHIQKRLKDWGPETFGEKSNAFLKQSVLASQSWLNVREVSGIEGLAEHYLSVCDGKLAPEDGLVIKI